MENRDNLLIAVDAGHGGWDNGASWQGRVEKDDNLRLALEVQKQLKAQGVDVLMTRDSDVFVELRDRANMANQADADLFISLHRNSYTEQTPDTNGVENWIYLTAPENTAGKAAELVLNEVVNVGVQNNRGVRRGNYYVVRKTQMPAMLLEMGYIINEEDNRLFDENLVEYAQAIARGAFAYFGVPFVGAGQPTAPVQQPVTPSPLPPSPVGPIPVQRVMSAEFMPQAQNPSDMVKAAQTALNSAFGSGLRVDGIYGPLTRAAAIRALQTATNNACGTTLPVDGILGPQTMAAIPEFTEGDRGEGVTLVQILLTLRGYDSGAIDGIFGTRTKAAVQMFQRDNFITPSGVANPQTILALLR